MTKRVALTLGIVAVAALAIASSASANIQSWKVPWDYITGKPATFAPAAHASAHASGGGDAVIVAQSQITDLTTDLAAKAPINAPTFTTNATAPYFAFSNGRLVLSGNGDPNGNYGGPLGSIYLRANGTLYVKQTEGTPDDASGWVAK